LSWQEAINYCETLNEPDHHNWRLPNQKELLSINDLKKYDPAADTNYFSYMLSAFYWSSTSHADYTGYAWGVYFLNGRGTHNAKDSSYYVRAVRGGQCRLFGHLVIWTPNQASKWTIASEMPIVWDTQLIPGNVQISISRKGGKEGTFEMLAETENDGLFDWLVTGPASVNCVLKIIPLDEPDKETSQSLFSIVDETSPTISPIDNQNVPKNSSCNISFTVSDTDNGSLMVWANSSNPALVANENINLGGMNPSFYTATTGGTTSIPMTITPAENITGTTTITLTTYDAGFLTQVAVFDVIVDNAFPPEISQIPDQEMVFNSTLGILFTVTHPSFSNNQLSFTAKSSNTSLVPDTNTNTRFSTSGSDCLLSLTPVSNQTGDTTMIITATTPDGQTDTTHFLLSVYQIFDITATASEGGQITPQGIIKVKNNDSQIFVFDADDHYALTLLLIDQAPVTFSEKNYTFSNIQDNHSIHASYSPVHRLKISVIPPAKGHISGDQINCPTECETFILDNTEIHLKANTIAGYDFSHWQGITSKKTELDLTITSPLSLTAVFNRNNPPDAPQTIYPENQEMIASMNLTLRAGQYIDPENNPHQSTWWMIRPFDQPYGCSEMNTPFCHIHSVGDLSFYEINGLISGMKYAWKVGYSDVSDETPLFSEEKTFIVGQSQIDETIHISASDNLIDFRMVSLIQWPEQSAGMHVFGDELGGNYDTNNFRIGSYDPLQSNYVECDKGLEIEPGRAYWILSRNPMPVQVNGVYVTMDIPIQIKLNYNHETKDGWNMIGCPNDAVYAWKKLKVVLYNDSEQMIDMNGTPVSESDIPTIEMLGSDNRLISTDILFWNNGAYKQLIQPEIPADEQVLEPYQGYWVNALQKNVYLRFDSSAYARKRNIKRSVYDGAREETLSSKLPPEPMPGLGEQGTNIDNCFVSLLFSDVVSVYILFGGLLIIVLLMTQQVVKQIKNKEPICNMH
jgi:hypothetical protein